MQKTHDITYINGYFPQNNIKYTEGTRHFVFTNQSDFETYFSVAKTMQNEVTAIDFEHYNIAAITAKPNNKKQQISISETIIDNSHAEIKYAVKEQGTQTYTSTAVVLMTIPKSVKTVEFVSETHSENMSSNRFNN
ncbi:hypothetical protein [Formosa haliotis]|uniref:hypothetical protein n=1 Tax=Formosa haliotis TaxID=1555194 RepID=UPI0008243353|nr:hypothetical protein [Formosa haliotis]